MATLTAKGAATRARIVAAAAGCMAQRGVAETSIDDVRGAANVSASQLYHYFADKQALTRAVIVHQTEQVVGGQEPLLTSLDSFAALQAWRDVVVAMQDGGTSSHGCPLGALSSELADLNETARVLLTNGFARWEAALREGLVRLSERGELRAGSDPDRLALALLAALQGGLLLSQARRDTAALEAGLDAILGSLAPLS
jgi:TetR/AcrR family transcriptional repressor of nem operon